MFSEAKVTEIYSLADDFCKEFAKYQENHMLPTFHKSGKHRNKPNRMSVAEIMLIMILFHSGGYRCFKHFYLEYVCWLALSVLRIMCGSFLWVTVFLLLHRAWR